MTNRSPINLWNSAWSGYTQPPEDYHEALVGALMRTVGSLQSKLILEVGAGSARDCLKLASLGAECTAVDMSPAALDLARAGMRSRHANIDLVLGNALQLPFRSETFDVVFSQGLLEHFEDPCPLLNEQIRLLRKGGLLLIDVPQTFNFYTLHKRRLMRQGKWFAGWETSYSLTRLQQLVAGSGLTIVETYGSGYYPRFLLAARHLHTLNKRHELRMWLPARTTEALEIGWQWLEGKRWYHKWMWNVGVVAKRQ